MYSTKTVERTIEDPTKSMLCKVQLEHSDYTPPPPDRPWISCDIEMKPGPYCIFSVMSYNTLSSSYASPQRYPYCLEDCLNWETRGQSIINEIEYYNCDVLCLQEVENKVFHEYLLPALETLGYSGVFAPKSRAKTMSSAKQRLVDGCAIFWKTEKFTLIAHELIEFNLLAMENHAGCDDMLNRVALRDNIGLFGLLKTTAAAWNDGLPENSWDVEQLVLITTTHLHWNPAFCDVKLLQTFLLTSEINKMLEKACILSGKDNIASSDIKLIVCGDFNSKTDSGVYEFLVTGQLAADHPDFRNLNYRDAVSKIFGNPKSTDTIQSNLNLLSACNEMDMLFTNYTYYFKAVIDFIFYRPSNIQPIGFYGMMDVQWFIENGIVGCPNRYIPSDHLPVIAAFKIV
ncbi:CCR4-NOT transcription complex subunit 6-like [Microplitis demolitor]|uniref:CCR4-NOT transcription complex subunit 6-like n=1 Tax=Microplitis demolitor TaxID=69319 RepID=UPI00235B60B0|nr:CCR4-NOT transcription complex subunit 6-like [Microplitis demolitor]